MVPKTIVAVFADGAVVQPDRVLRCRIKKREKHLGKRVSMIHLTGCDTAACRHENGHDYQMF